MYVDFAAHLISHEIHCYRSINKANPDAKKCYKIFSRTLYFISEYPKTYKVRIIVQRFRCITMMAVIILYIYALLIYQFNTILCLPLSVSNVSLGAWAIICLTL